MKKLIGIISIVFLLFTQTALVSAASQADSIVISVTRQYLDDNSYFESVITTDGNALSRSSKTSSKTTTYYNADDEAMWYAKVTGTFSYNNSTSSCTSATASAGSYHDLWKISDKSASRSGNTAKATVTAKHYYLMVPIDTVTKTVTLSCDKYGNLS